VSGLPTSKSYLPGRLTDTIPTRAPPRGARRHAALPLRRIYQGYCRAARVLGRQYEQVRQGAGDKEGGRSGPLGRVVACGGTERDSGELDWRASAQVVGG
jgi:hypothetical protein